MRYTVLGRPQLVDSKADRCRSGRSSTLGKRSAPATPSHFEERQRTRDQRLNLPELPRGVRLQTSIFFEVLKPTYHSPITIESLIYGLLLSMRQYSSRRVPFAEQSRVFIALRLHLTALESIS